MAFDFTRLVRLAFRLSFNSFAQLGTVLAMMRSADPLPP
jgi:hypothetical protein